MKKAATLIILSLLIVLQGWTQKSYEMEVHNLVQLNETEFTFDVRMRNTNPTEPFAIEAIQWQLSLDDFRNGGILDNAYLTYVANSTDLEGAVVPGSSGFTTNVANTVLQMITPILEPGEQTTYFGDGDWKTIGTFKLQLRNATNTGFLNFADMHHGLDLITTGVLVFHCNFTESGGQYFRSGNDAWLIEIKTLTNSLSDRQLAGYYFDGSSNNDYFDSDNWNNVTTTNPNNLPGSGNNAIINAECIVADGTTDELNELAVAEFGFLTISDDGAVIADKLFIDNPDDNTKSNNQIKSGGLLARWGFDGTLNNPQANPVPADEGNPNNISGPKPAKFHANVNYRGRGSNPTVAEITNPSVGNYFYAKVNTLDYKDIELSFEMYALDDSKQNLNVIIEASLDETDWIPIGYSFNIVINTWTSHLTSINEDYNNQEEVYVRWRITSVSDALRYSIRNIVVNGTLDIPKLLIKSTKDGTGYLIHNNEGVEATIERYLSQYYYHYVSTPIIGATYELFQYEGTYPPTWPEYADFFKWVEADMIWYNLNLAPPATTLDIAAGYAVAYSDEDKTKEFVGEVNVGSYQFNASYTPLNSQGQYWHQRGYNLVGNPYAAALDADEFILANSSTPDFDIHGLYFWDEAPGYTGNRISDYATYTLAGGVGTSSRTIAGGGVTPNGNIAPTQGFLAHLVPAANLGTQQFYNLSFDPSWRTAGDSHFFKEVEDRSRLWFSITGPNGDYNEILVAFMEGAEVGFDITDAVKIKGNSNLALYSYLDDIECAIQGFPELFDTDTYEIPLGVDSRIVGQYTFSLVEMENFDQNTDITFEDRLAGQIINLKTTSEYVVHIADTLVTDRFYLHINGPTSVQVVDKKLSKVFAVNNQIFVINNANSDILDVEVINTLGQRILKTPVNASEASITVPGRNLVYIVKVRTSEGVESHKLLIR